MPGIPYTGWITDLFSSSINVYQNDNLVGTATRLNFNTDFTVNVGGVDKIDVSVNNGPLDGVILSTDLTSLTGTYDSQIAHTVGRSTAGDDGGGTFYWHSGSSTTADGGTVFGNTIAGRWKRQFTGPVNVKWFGAKGDGTTNDTSALQTALNFARDNDARIEAEPGQYKITSTLTIECSGDLSDAEILAAGASFSPAIRVGKSSGTGNAAQLRLDLLLPQVKNTSKTSTGWSGFDSAVGVEIANLYESRVTIPRIDGFGIGLWVGGTTAGNVYNTYRLGMLWQNKIHLRIGGTGVDGWSNENIFEGGRFGYDSGEGAISGGRSIQFLMFSGSTVGQPNNNLLLRPAVEGDEPEFHFEFSDAAYNTVINPRFEVPVGSPKIKLHSTATGETNSNLIIGGYRDKAIVVTRTGNASPLNKVMGSRLNDSQEYTGCGVSLVNRSGDTVSAPHIQGFPSAQFALDKSQSSTDWIYRLHGDGLSVKSSGDANPRVIANAAGFLYLGLGSSAATAYFRGAGSPNEIVTNALFYPDADNTRGLGFSGRRWKDLHITDIRPGTGAAKWTSGAGSPEGAVGGNVGSLYTRTDGGAGSTLYVKESGTGNTGWVAK